MTETDSNSDPPVEPTADAEAETAAEAAAKSEGADVASDAEGPVESAKPKKKRKKRARSEASEPLRAELDEQGRDRPAFLLGFPRDPELEPLIRAFESGNYALLRADAPRLIERSTNAEIKAAATELLQRIEPDPLVKFLLAVAVALFCAVVGYVYLSH